MISKKQFTENEQVEQSKQNEKFGNLNIKPENNFVPQKHSLDNEDNIKKNINTTLSQNYKDNIIKENEPNLIQNQENTNISNPLVLNKENKNIQQENIKQDYNYPIVESVYMTESEIMNDPQNQPSNIIKPGKDIKQISEMMGNYEISKPSENKEKERNYQQINEKSISPTKEILYSNQSLQNFRGEDTESKNEISINKNIQDFQPGFFPQIDKEEKLEGHGFLIPNQSVIIKSNTKIKGINCIYEQNNIDIKIDLGCGHKAHKNCLNKKLVEVDKETGNLRDIFCDICSKKIDYRVLVSVNSEIAENLDISSALLNNYLQSSIEE